TVTDRDTNTVAISRPEARRVGKKHSTMNDPDENNQDVGDTVTYSYSVTNTGNVTLSGITVVDDNGTAGNTADDKQIVLSATTLAPSASTTGTYTHTLTQVEVDAGSITNIAVGSSGTVTDRDTNTVAIS